jgi:uncharacterized protein (DUF58 family)
MPFLSRRAFMCLAGVVVVLVAGHFFDPLYYAGVAGLALFAALVAVDATLLYRVQEGVVAERLHADRFSNGDDNDVDLVLHSRYRFPVSVTVLDEVPVQLQQRNVRHEVGVPAHGDVVLRYTIRPVHRGEYGFGAINLFVRTRLGLVERHVRMPADSVVAVYPSILQMQRYALMHVGHRLEQVGLRRVRRLGHTLEFDHIREYVRGDDYRAINWKAFARSGTLMVNQHRDEQSQPVYCLVDRGRSMRMPFGGLTLLDYAINTSLVMADTTMRRHDHAGLVLFGAGNVESFVEASRRPGHLTRILETLYRVDTRFGETDFAALQALVMRRIPRRSLLLLFTNFESIAAVRRQLPYLRALSRRHVLVVAFFENVELTRLASAPAETLEHVYVKTIAERFTLEKHEIAIELQRHGIHSIVSPPSDLTVHSINKYFELKSMGTI